MLLIFTRKLMRTRGGSSLPISADTSLRYCQLLTRVGNGVGVGCHTWANRAARRSDAWLDPPTQIGGCGCCIGLGLVCRPSKEKNRPWNDTGSGSQHAFHSRRYSLVRAPRSRCGTSSAAYSISFQPEPTPTMARPLDI